MIRYVPSPSTLKKYGLSKEYYQGLLRACQGRCRICGRTFGKVYGKSKKPLLPVIDHIHVRGYKNMFVWEKRKYVRGLICNYDNRRRVGKGITLEIARNIVAYLEEYEARISK